MQLLLQTGQNRVIAISASPGQKLSEAIWLSGKVPPQPLCGGLGLCGRCRVRFMHAPPAPCPEDLEKFSGPELEAGWRLACHHPVPDCAELLLEQPAAEDRTPAKKQGKGAGRAALGIDFGTTSIYWRATGPEEHLGYRLEGILANPQAGAGPDVISRLAYASNAAGEKRLSDLGLQAITSILESMEQNGLSVETACIAANSAMTCILLNKDIGGLLSAPYSLAYHGNEIINLDLPGCERPLPVVIPPLPGPFVGGDIVAGLIALSASRPFLLADLGTNAEFALLDAEGRLFLASAPLGPALEGIGPRCGQQAGAGVITGFELSPLGLRTGVQDGGCEIAGIGATGYLSLLALLLRAGIMDAEGHFRAEQSMPLARKIIKGLKENRLELDGGQYLTSEDIEILLKVKAAFRIILDLILQAACLEPADIEAFYLAGALGEYVAVDDLATLGFIPASLARKVKCCGNSSLSGACILAASPDRLKEAAELCADAEILQMTETENFLNLYMTAMHWGQA